MSNGVDWWKLWEELKSGVDNFGGLEKMMVECGIEKGDVLNKLCSSVRNYSYNRGYRKDNFKSDGKLKEENKELMRRLKELEKRVEG